MREAAATIQPGTLVETISRGWEDSPGASRVVLGVVVESPLPGAGTHQFYVVALSTGRIARVRRGWLSTLEDAEATRDALATLKTG